MLVQLLEFLFLQDVDLSVLVIRQDILHELADLFDHSKRQELVDVTVRRFNLVVEVLATIFQIGILGPVVE